MNNFSLTGKTTRLFLLVILFLSVTLLVFQERGCLAVEPLKPTQEKEEREAPLPVNVFADRETVTFGVYSNGLKVGTGRLGYLGIETFQQQKSQHIVLDVKTFSIKDREDIFGDLFFSAPLKVERQLRIFGRQESITEEYAKDQKSVRIVKIVNNQAPTSQDIVSEIELSNVLLWVYYLRNDPGLKVGKSYPIALPTQTFNLVVKEVRKIKVPLGSFDAFYITSTPPKYRIWLSTGKDRLPVRIQGVVPAGMVYLAATEVHNQ